MGKTSIKISVITAFTLAIMLFFGSSNALAASFDSGKMEDIDVWGYTDASYYTKKATSVDFLIGTSYPFGHKKGTLYLQRKSGKSWKTCKSKTFDFVYHVEKSFPLKGCSTGYYRIKAKITYSYSKDYSYNYSNSFKVNR